MKIDRVTMTGADESISQPDLAWITSRYPIVEWGILVSKSRTGVFCPRFPSLEWIRKLIKMNAYVENRMNLALHVCGSWVRDFLVGGDRLIGDLGEILPAFARIQLNFHAEDHQVDLSAFVKNLRMLTVEHDVILQMDGVNESFFNLVRSATPRVVPLFDRSGGAGQVPEDWPFPFADIYNGYAGGLGPDTIEQELERIAEKVGNKTIWIDMEGRIRSERDRQFDMIKVARCLELAKPYFHEAKTSETTTPAAT